MLGNQIHSLVNVSQSRDKFFALTHKDSRRFVQFIYRFLSVAHCSSSKKSLPKAEQQSPRGDALRAGMLAIIEVWRYCS
jgi:hypothetical protein